MPKFHFHLYENADSLLDPEGVDCDVSSLAERTLTAARAIIAADAIEGDIDLRHRIDVQNDAGAVVHSLLFSQAVRHTQPEQSGGSGRDKPPRAWT